MAVWEGDGPAAQPAGPTEPANSTDRTGPTDPTGPTSATSARRVGELPGREAPGGPAPAPAAQAVPGAPANYDTLLATAEAVLDDVDQALTRLRRGTYGTCEVCGRPIADDRLAAQPTARSCGDHPTLADRQGDT